MEREQSQTKRNEKEHENDLGSVSMFFVVLHRTQTISEQVVVEVLRESRALLRVDLKVVYPCFTRNTGSEITSNTRKRFLFTNTKTLITFHAQQIHFLTCTQMRALRH